MAEIPNGFTRETLNNWIAEHLLLNKAKTEKEKFEIFMAELHSLYSQTQN